MQTFQSVQHLTIIITDSKLHVFFKLTIIQTIDKNKGNHQLDDDEGSNSQNYIH